MKRIGNSLSKEYLILQNSHHGRLYVYSNQVVITQNSSGISFCRIAYSVFFEYSQWW